MQKQVRVAVDIGLSVLAPCPWSRQVPGTPKEVPKEPRSTLHPGLGINERGGCPVSCYMALKETCLFLCLAFLPAHGGSLSIGARGRHPHCFRGSHSTRHPPRAVEIGVLCGLWAGNGPLRLQREGHR